MKEEFLRIICGEDVKCRSEVLNEIRALFFAPPLEAERHHSLPLISPDGGDPVEFIRKARYLRERYSDLFREWSGDFCPICGLRPLVYIRREEGDIYTAVVRYAKCSCGFEWRYHYWRCPNCGGEGRYNFAVYFVGGALMYRCRSCGYKTVEVDADVDEETLYLARVVVSYVD